MCRNSLPLFNLKYDKDLSFFLVNLKLCKIFFREVSLFKYGEYRGVIMFKGRRRTIRSRGCFRSTRKVVKTY
ncbi:hypothetical protein DMP16_05440 [Sulfolobus sp. B1]|nr:hypothetical protein DJ523_04810 [Sulfolobus sp. E5]TRM86549.1 hypothetical protein DJ529_11075 [Sulfolobus sp. C3]TRM96715.1 hypothetical protein DMP16_05440 [Sulfolobus sp. B1]TRM99142.1 hypothetical protein DJ527_09170 [Sulfolobus sp. F1]TRN04034.1 hypothetical protein DJ530_01725 [Sulfolobus sp. E1]